MQIEEKIQTFWRNSEPLCATIPPERFLTGPAPLPGVPCVLVISEKTEVLFRTNRSDPWNKTVLRFELYHESFERASEIARLIEQSFDRLVLNESEQGRSFRFRFLQGEQTRTELPSKGELWKFIRCFQGIG